MLLKSKTPCHRSSLRKYDYRNDSCEQIFVSKMIIAIRKKLRRKEEESFLVSTERTLVQLYLTLSDGKWCQITLTGGWCISGLFHATRPVHKTPQLSLSRVMTTGVTGPHNQWRVP